MKCLILLSLCLLTWFDCWVEKQICHEVPKHLVVRVPHGYFLAKEQRFVHEDETWNSGSDQFFQCREDLYVPREYDLEDSE